MHWVNRGFQANSPANSSVRLWLLTWVWWGCLRPAGYSCANQRKGRSSGNRLYKMLQSGVNHKYRRLAILRNVSVRLAMREGA